MLAYAYNIIVDCDVVVYVLNTAYKRFLSILISNMQVPGSRGYDNLMAIHTSTNREEVSIARQCQEHLSETTRKNGVIDQGNYINRRVNINGMIVSIVLKKLMMLLTEV